MFSGSNSSFRLFTVSGIAVYLHWTWFLVAIYQIQLRGEVSLSVGAAIYIGLFAIVLLHEFGHALACRQVGGTAKEILLLPIGGIAYVSPPRRPGAVLWSIAAGPLVNVALIPVFSIIMRLLSQEAVFTQSPHLYEIFYDLQRINYILLIFNLLPVYPLDGGQILQALLWFKLGQARSLAVASAFGLVTSAGLLGWMLWTQRIFEERQILLGLIVAFLLYRSWVGFQQARALIRIEKWPRHQGYRCPNCQTAPPVGDIWRCGQCEGTFDAFAHDATCPHCGHQAHVTACPECGQSHPISQWKDKGTVIDA